LLLWVLLVSGGYFWFSTELPGPEKLQQQISPGNTRIVDRHGTLLYQVPNALNGYQTLVPLDNIPLALRQATIAIEDDAFYRHAGIDVWSIGRAAWDNLRAGKTVAGGSTITQQVARNVLMEPHLARQRTLTRKAREIVLALKLSRAHPKDRILELYLNQTYYGGMAYGVEAAAHHVFGKPVRDLSLAECTVIAGLPQAPSSYDPLRNPQAARTRQTQVLDAMVRSEFITAAQAEQAKEEPLQFATSDPAFSPSMQAPHFVYYIIHQLHQQVDPHTLARGGLTITTTLDARLQQHSQDTLRRHRDQLSTPFDGEPDHRIRNGAIVVLDPSSGAILTMVGSPDFHDQAHDGQVNATLALRQPGSAIKPLTYAAAIEQGWTPASVVLDVPSSFPTREGQPYTPENYDRTFRGPLSLREALAISSNVAAVRMLDRVGIPALLDIAQRVGITTLGTDESRYGLSLTLGGGEVTLLELTTAYAVFANGGKSVQPFAIRRITNSRGEEIYHHTPPPVAQVISPQVAYLISDILSDPYARMPVFGLSSPMDLDRPAAAKTGTTSDWRDNWTLGYTPHRAAGVWVGNANGEPMEAISGITGAGPVWQEVMLAAHQTIAPHPFVAPPGIVEVRICAEGGMLPSPVCPATRLERFIAGTEPGQPDNTHALVAVDPLRNCRAPGSYPQERTALRLFRLVPPQAEAWAIEAGIPRIPGELCNRPLGEEQKQEQEQGHLAAGGNSNHRTAMPSPALINPANGTTFKLSSNLPHHQQGIELQARAGGQVTSLTIIVDGTRVATFREPPYTTLWMLEAGHHTASVEVEDRQGKRWRSPEIEFVVLE
jgi:1A family penicillin-binding protein